jgi:hypothetical protein
MIHGIYGYTTTNNGISPFLWRSLIFKTPWSLTSQTPGIVCRFWRERTTTQNGGRLKSFWTWTDISLSHRAVKPMINLQFGDGSYCNPFLVKLRIIYCWVYYQTCGHLNRTTSRWTSYVGKLWVFPDNINFSHGAGTHSHPQSASCANSQSKFRLCLASMMHHYYLQLRWIPITTPKGVFFFTNLKSASHLEVSIIIYIYIESRL